jgi:HEAT repeat protein
MTSYEAELLHNLSFGKIKLQEFYEKFPVDIRNTTAYVNNEILNAVESSDPEKLDEAIYLLMVTNNESAYIDTLNNLLLNPNHRSHQMITKTIQDIGSDSSIPFIRKVLESNFDYLEYTCSESGAIAKWFSWALYSIGTKEAIDLMKEFADSPDEGISDEMKYRLNKLNQ